MGNQCTSYRLHELHRNKQIANKKTQRQSQIIQIKNKNPQSQSQNQIQKAKIRMTNPNKINKDNHQSFGFNQNRVSFQKSAFNVSNPYNSVSITDKTTSRYTVSSGQKVCHLHNSQSQIQNPDQQQVFEIYDMVINQENFPNSNYQENQQNQIPTTFGTNSNPNHKNKKNQLKVKCYPNSEIIQQNEIKSKDFLKNRVTK